MRGATLIVIIGMMAGCATNTPSYELTDMNPIRVRFGPVRAVFVHPDAPQSTVELTKNGFMRDEGELVIDAVLPDKDGDIWCKRIDKKTYSLPFLVRLGSLEKLQRLKGASIAQLTSLIGGPVVMKNNYEGTVIWEWLICNGQRGDQFQAIDVAAGLSPPSKKVQFLLIRVAQGE